MSQRVVVTGIGVICGVASSVEQFAAAIKEGRHGFSRISDPRLSHLKATHAAMVREVPLSSEDAALTQGMDRFVHLSLFALRQALSNAGLSGQLGPRAATVLGTCSGGMLSTEKQFENRLHGQAICDESDYFSARYYSAAKVLACATGASGPSATVVTACAAGAGAVAYGTDLIRIGLCDVSLTGGADTFAASTLVGFDALKATCEGICAPFSENIGLNLGEGSGFLVLESLDHAKRRHAPILGEILGSGLSNDAYHATSPDPSGKGQIAAMERALADAGISPHHIDYVNAHGTGTRANDSVESRAVAKVLKDRSDKVPLSSTKSMIGHCLGAAGALEAAAVIIAADQGVLPPTVGFTAPREGCGLDYVPDPGRPFKGSIVLSNSFGFGGNNACLTLHTRPNLDKPFYSRESKPIRPVITGVGMIHALGIDHEMLDATPADTGISKITRFKVTDENAVAALVPEIDCKKIDRRLDLRSMDLCSKYATVAARLAMENAMIPIRPVITAEIGMVLGLSFGPSAGETAHAQGVIESKYRLDRVDSFPYVVQNETAGHAARVLLLKGHNTVFSTGWGAGLSALTAAAAAIQSGHGKTLIAAASDELTERSFRDAQEAKIFGSDSRTIAGEGAAAFIVEDFQGAVDRNARIYAEILGYGAATDTADLQCITKDAAIAALITAMERSGISSTEIRWVAASGTDCVAGAIESCVLEEFYPKAEQISLVHRLGFPEAALCLFNLNRALHLAALNDGIAGLSISREGVAHAVVLKRC